MKRLLGILTVSFFLMNFSSAATYNAAESLTDEELDSIIRVKKDSLLEVLNARIDLSVNFLKINKEYINNIHDGLLFLMLNEHFKLGINNILPNLEKEKKAYLRLYGKYFNNNKDFRFQMDESVDFGGEVINQGFIDALNDGYSRQLFGSFCEQLHLSNSYLNYLQDRSALSENNLLEMYMITLEYNQNKCTDLNGISKNNQVVMSEKLKALIANKESGDNNKVKALALLQYGGNVDVRYVYNNVSLLLESQDKLGFWATDINNTGDPDGLTTIFGLWALCSFRDSLLKLK